MDSMAATPNDLTRQQLDELDHLLQRMLAMPLSQPEARSAPVKIAIPSPPDIPAMALMASDWRLDAPQTSPPAPHLNTEPTPEPVLAMSATTSVAAYAMPAPQPLAPVERPMVPAMVVLPEPPPVSPVVLDLPMPRFGKFDLADVPPAAPITTVPITTAPATPPAVPMALWPIAAVNWLMETTLNMFGTPGHALTSRAGKNLLGVTGMMMLAAAGLYTLNGQGVIHLPIDNLIP
jgi:hypothetical protein